MIVQPCGQWCGVPSRQQIDHPLGLVRPARFRSSDLSGWRSHQLPGSPPDREQDRAALGRVATGCCDSSGFRSSMPAVFPFCRREPAQSRSASPAAAHGDGLCGGSDRQPARRTSSPRRQPCRRRTGEPSTTTPSADQQPEDQPTAADTGSALAPTRSNTSGTAIWFPEPLPADEPHYQTQ
ncbi:hypothetical protein J3R03_003088 [Actinoplanes couchii]|nr:hypothetical protein [Actinoplanes couchii]